ncbi:hypothetical protein Ddye_023129 [Dipteronia dyeriana]|uniref:DUF4283 domain-containing protein n=1 Tax=Dipteronia dyeriana TaxID=168575 RepID=A0AAD9TSJ2_9ROSI|nr:hypothetical protein Ddye_023129 [Dipteronia dyeriana]
MSQKDKEGLTRSSKNDLKGDDIKKLSLTLVGKGKDDIADMKVKAEFWVQIHNVLLWCMSKRIGQFLGNVVGEVTEIDEGAIRNCDDNHVTRPMQAAQQMANCPRSLNDKENCGRVVISVGLADGGHLVTTGGLIPEKEISSGDAQRRQGLLLGRIDKGKETKVEIQCAEITVEEWPEMSLGALENSSGLFSHERNIPTEFVATGDLDNGFQRKVVSPFENKGGQESRVLLILISEDRTTDHFKWRSWIPLWVQVIGRIGVVFTLKLVGLMIIVTVTWLIETEDASQVLDP